MRDMSIFFWIIFVVMELMFYDAEKTDLKMHRNILENVHKLRLK